MAAARQGSMYAAMHKQTPGPGTYESYSSIKTPRSSPRGTFGTGPMRASFAKGDGAANQYSPRVLPMMNREHSFPKDPRFQTRHLTGDPGAYNPRPRSETKASAAYSLGARRPQTVRATPGPGAHDIARFGDTCKYDSFQKLNQPSPRYSFGTLARPLTLSQSAQSLRRTPRSDLKAASGPISPRHPLVLNKKGDTNVYAPAEPPAHLVTHASPSSGALGPGAYVTSQNLGTRHAISTSDTAPKYTILTKKEERSRFISKEHSVASNYGTTGPGPALYHAHGKIGVGVKPITSKLPSSGKPVAPVLQGEYIRGPMTKPRGPAFGFGTAGRDAPGGLVVLG